MSKKIIKEYTKEDLQKVIKELKLNLPIELTFSTGDIDVLEINGNGWVKCLDIKSGIDSKIRVSELTAELVNHNTELVNYILKNK